jgi:hypothetical protein
MGNTNGIPRENKFYSSYCKQIDLIDRPILESVDLGSLNSNNFIVEIIQQQITKLGYSIKIKVPEINNNNTIKEMINTIKLNGFMSSDYSGVLSDLKINGTCYYPRNIKYLISKGTPLVAGIILDNDIMKSIDFPEIPQEVTDIICIVGYTQDSLLIKTTWSYKILNLDISFIDNIKEVWEIIIESPEPTDF